MAWYRCLGGGGGQAPLPITYTNYLKFNARGLLLPWTLDADHKIEVVFYETTYVNLTSVFGTPQNQARANLTSYQNKYYTCIGTSETSFGTWTAGEHTFIANNGNNHNEFDGEEVTTYTPTTGNYPYIIGGRGSVTDKAFQGWIKSFKIYSISTGEILHDLRPCIFCGVSCLFDEISKMMFTNEKVVAVDTIG